MILGIRESMCAADPSPASYESSPPVSPNLGPKDGA